MFMKVLLYHMKYLIKQFKENHHLHQEHHPKQTENRIRVANPQVNLLSIKLN